MAPKDFISEEEFNAHIARKSPKSPQKDSPGDSAVNSAHEIEMGIYFEPEKPRRRRKKDIPAFDRGHNR